ncbi:MAG: hydantoinase B/oxoprolinase family protein [Desulfurococcaceae archaeon]
MQVNPFTLEIIKNAIIVANEEMFYAWARTAKSPVIYEVLDFSVGITNAKGDLVAEAPGVPGFSGVLDFVVKEAIEKWIHDLHPGDVIVNNVPYGSGTHLNDVALIAPIFYKDVLVGFTATKGHWSEVGGMAFGSWNPHATEIYQEGLQLPNVKLYVEGRPNKDVIDIILANSRLPDNTLDDMESQVASMRVAARRIISLVDKYGLDAVLTAMERIIEDGERYARIRLRELPKGVFEAEDYIDAAIASSDKPIYVRARVEITDEGFVVDFTGSSRQVPSPINSPYPATVAGVKEVYMAIIDPHVTPNAGLFKPLKVIAPQGSIFNPVKPAPTSTFWEAMAFATDLVWKALAPHVRDRLTAGHFLSIIATIIGGVDDRTGEPFAIVEPQPGGWGAGYDMDGTSGLVAVGDGETYIASTEVYEKNFPILVERYTLNTEDGVGHGKYRGGFGVIREYRILNSTALVTIQVGRHDYPPWGVEGGLPGPGNRVVVYRQGSSPIEVRRMTAEIFKKGDLVSIRTSGGGGWGDPLDRDPMLVLQDYINELITLGTARDIYGVVIDPSRRTIDWEKTFELRKKLRELRGHV